MSQICVYISHGSIPALKGIPRAYKKLNVDEIQIVATYNPDGTYTSIYDPIVTYTHEEFIKHIASSSITYDAAKTYTYKELVEFIQSNNTVKRLSADTNLDKEGAGKCVSDHLRCLVEELHPEELFLFSSTPESVNDANNNYLKSLPEYVKRGIAVLRENIFLTDLNHLPDLLKVGKMDENASRNSALETVASIPSNEAMEMTDRSCEKYNSHRSITTFSNALSQDEDDLQNPAISVHEPSLKIDLQVIASSPSLNKSTTSSPILAKMIPSVAAIVGSWLGRSSPILAGDSRSSRNELDVPVELNVRSKKIG